MQLGCVVCLCLCCVFVFVLCVCVALFERMKGLNEMNEQDEINGIKQLV